MTDKTAQLDLELYLKKGRGTVPVPGSKTRGHRRDGISDGRARRVPRAYRTQRERILVYLLHATEGTRREMAERLGILENSLALRLHELERNLLLRREGLRRYQGYECERWILTDEGRLAAVKVIEEKPE